MRKKTSLQKDLQKKKEAATPVIEDVVIPPTKPPTPAPVYDIRDTTLTERARLLYTAIMSAIAIGDSGTDILRFLSQFKENNTLIGNNSFDVTITDILKDIAKEQGVSLSDEELLSCLTPRLIKNESGKQEIIFLCPKQMEKVKKAAEKLQRKTL